MKSKLIILLFLFTTVLAYSQKGINYKALIKDDNNNPLSNQNITIEFSILEGPEMAFTDVVYAETHTANTDDNGIVIVNIGEGVPVNGFEDAYNNINWGIFFGSHFLNVQIDSGSGFTDLGTTEFKAVPYALFAKKTNDTGLELINEGNGNGYRFIGRNPDFYGSIADGAVDLSLSYGTSSTKGATGNYATAVGYNTTASGQSSFASGVGTIASQSQSTAMGAGTIASGHSSTAIGLGTRAEAPNTTAIGLYNIGGGDPLLASSTDPLFEIGNGQYVDGTNDVRTNALTVLRNGEVTAPSFDISEITDPKALITKEYLEANASVSTGLEAIDEGNGMGYRLSGSDPTYFGNIGDRAVDLSYGGDTGYDAGLGAYGTGSVAMGQYTSAGNGSVAMGYNSTASGQYATAMGNVTTASGLFSTSAGFYTVASGLYSTALGNATIADDQNTTVLGKFNDNTLATNTLFQVGNGTNNDNRSNALVVDSDGIITAPSFDTSEITDPKALITKEYADANYSGGGSGTNSTGLEALDEGNGIGWRLVDSNPLFYGNIGLNAVDVSSSDDPNEPYGATGANSFAAGKYTIASGLNSFAVGFGNIASGVSSMALGSGNLASNSGSISLGYNTISDRQFLTVVGKYNANIYNSILFEIGNGIDNNNRSNALNVFNDGTITAPSFDIAEITDPKALITKEYLEANSSTSSGLETINEGNGIGWRLIGRDPNNYDNIGENAVDLSVSNNNSVILGASGIGSLAAGIGVEASGNYSFAQGGSTKASGLYAVALGYATDASGPQSIAMGGFSSSSATFSAALGRNTIADDNNSTVVGTYNDNTTSTSTIFQVGNGTTNTNRSNALTVYQNGNIEMGNYTNASGFNSTAMGGSSNASGNYSTAMGSNTTASGLASTAMGINSEASNSYSTAMGSNSLASGDTATAMGTGTQALGTSSTAFGSFTVASGNISIATGEQTLASAYLSTAMGRYTIADDFYSTVIGKYNDNTSSSTTLFQIGNGTATTNRSNAFTVYQSGNALIAGTLTQSSDRRLKKDIEDLNYGLNEILALTPKAYHWKNREQDYKSLGLIAQEVQPIINEIVHVAEDEDKTMSVSYTELIPVLIKAIQEQQDIIDQQNSKIIGLTTEVKDLKNLDARVKQIETLLKTTNQLNPQSSN